MCGWGFARCGRVCFSSKWHIISLSFIPVCHSPLLLAPKKSRQSPVMTGHFWRQHLNRWWVTCITPILVRYRHLRQWQRNYHLYNFHMVSPARSICYVIKKCFLIIKQYNVTQRKCVSKRPLFHAVVSWVLLSFFPCLGQIESYWTSPHLLVKSPGLRQDVIAWKG